MYFYFIGNFGHGHGLELGTAFDKKVFLTIKNLAGDPFDCVLALIDRANEKLACPHLVADVFLFLGGQDTLGNEFLVGPVDF